MKEQLSQAWDKMLEQVGSWLDKLVMNLPNFILACVVFLGTFLVSKYINKLMLKALGRTSMQDSMRRITAKLISVVVIVLGLFLH